MSDTQGRFVWYELMTTDTAAARAFYGKVVGWGAQAAPPPNDSYTLLTLNGQPVCGLMDLPESARKMGAPPSWIGYVAVDDVDAATAEAKRLGGRVHVEPCDIPDVGRFSVIADPQTAALGLFKLSNPMPGQPQPDQFGPGRTGWHELNTVDREKAFAFYNAMFGWQKAEAVDMGPLGIYQIISSAGGPAIGGMFNKPPAVPACFWLYYFNVTDIDAAVTRVKDGGGQIVNGPMQVPGGTWVVQGMDPQGAMFALVGARS